MKKLSIIRGTANLLSAIFLIIFVKFINSMVCGDVDIKIRVTSIITFVLVLISTIWEIFFEVDNKKYNKYAERLMIHLLYVIISLLLVILLIHYWNEYFLIFSSAMLILKYIIVSNIINMVSQ
jgi:hypothetical protein